jgi:AcrR family transcriptional regulator
MNVHYKNGMKENATKIAEKNSTILVPKRRGRPPKHIEGQDTQDRLLSAAAAAFAEHGYRAATLSDIAKRANVTTGAIYNHFAGKEDLLLAASRAALDALSRAGADARISEENGLDNAFRAARAFIAPGFRQTRRLLIELHLAATRFPHVATLLSEWHREQYEGWREVAASGRSDLAPVVKTYFLLLMGLTHIDSLSVIDVPLEEIDGVITKLLRTLMSEIETTPQAGS